MYDKILQDKLKCLFKKIDKLENQLNPISVQSVTGRGVNNTDPLNPVVSPTLQDILFNGNNAIQNNGVYTNLTSITPSQTKFTNSNSTNGITNELQINSGLSSYGLSFIGKDYQLNSIGNGSISTNNTGLELNGQAKGITLVGGTQNVILKSENSLFKGILGERFFNKQNDPNAYAQLQDIYNNAGDVIPIGTDRQVLGYSSGIPTAVTLGWKQLSDLPSPPPFLNGVYVGTAFQPDGSALFAFIELGIDSDAKPTTIPIYNSGTIGLGGGTLKVQSAINNLDAVNLGQLNNLLTTKADLVGGIIPSSQLPSSIDDVLDGTYINSTTFNNPSNVPYVPMTNAIYVDINTNLTYRWTNTSYVAIGNQLALGETSSTAYRGDRGKIAYDHSQITSGNPHGTTFDTVAQAGNTSTVPIAVGPGIDTLYSLTLRQLSSIGGAGTLKMLDTSGNVYAQVRQGQGIECATFASIGATGTYSANTNMIIRNNNQNGNNTTIGNSSANTAASIISNRNYISYIDGVIPFTGSNAPEWNLNRYINTINLSGMGSNPTIVRTIYNNPTISNIGANHRYRFIESTVGGAYFNTTSPQDSAILQADSTTQGFLPPRMTEAQRLAIVSPINGLIVYQTNNTSGLYLYDASTWIKFS